MSEPTVQATKKRNRRKKKKINNAMKLEGGTESSCVADKTPKVFGWLARERGRGRGREGGREGGREMCVIGEVCDV